MNIKKSVKSVVLKSIIRFNEKKYKNGNRTLRYLFSKAKSSVLIVIFSGFSGENERPKYNYIRSLNNIRTNKLFILDNFGYGNRGTYYLGENNDFYVEKSVDELIEIIKKKYGITKTVFLGSSKGGTSALYFGTKHEADYIIAGAPQYYIGSYLKADWHSKILKGIMGDTKEVSINFLNTLLPQAISEGNTKTKIYLHYSVNDRYTYQEHVLDLIKDINNKGYTLIEDIQSYKNHNDVAKSFPIFMKTALKNDILANQD
ncbi:serine aminopeptidase domain-containing protein [Paenibacillus sanguinis]|uniref:serine aminopeptidase domain-containing protein n=1 Tax=Paenibacillus sanguinis TaxID=225906 RepID=UPI00035D30B5|nr:alpha/beta hydrolase [Paenibacillus sanguinis]